MAVELEEPLHLEVTRSELRRARILTRVFTALAVVSVVIQLLFHEQIATYLLHPYSFLFLLIAALVFIIYEQLVVFLIRKKIEKGEALSESFKILNQLDEISFPTLTMVGMIYLERQYYILDAPGFWLYFIFIIFSALHLNFKISLITGIFSAAAYAVIAWWALGMVEWPENTPQPYLMYLIKAIILIVAGASAGFVGEELRTRMHRATDMARRNKELEMMFGQYVSRGVAHELLKQLKHSRRSMATIMFLDIRNFSLFADQWEPSEIIDFQNKFFSLLIDLVESHGGIINQFLGDGIMATFGAVDDTNGALPATRAGVSMFTKIREAVDDKHLPPVQIGIGLHTGEVVTGSIGNEDRKQYSISGMPVILAARMEELTKKYKHPLLISESVYNRISFYSEFEVHALGQEQLKGYAKPMHIYAVQIPVSLEEKKVSPYLHE